MQHESKEPTHCSDADKAVTTDNQELAAVKSLLNTAGFSIGAAVLVSVILLALIPWVGAALALLVIGVMGFLMGYHSEKLRSMPKEWSSGVNVFNIVTWVILGLSISKSSLSPGRNFVETLLIIIGLFVAVSIIACYVGLISSRRCHKV